MSVADTMSGGLVPYVFEHDSIELLIGCEGFDTKNRSTKLF